MDKSQISRIDRVFAEWDRPDSPGCALLIQKDGEVIYSKGYGSAQLEYGLPIKPDTVFHVASVSKQFTAMCTLLLAQDGKLSLDDPVQKHLPEVPYLGETVTLRHLVHHVSGVRDQWELLRMAGWRMDDVITREDIMRMMVRQREMNFKPGSEYLYSNMGYSLLAETVARVSGMPFREFAKKRIFEPLEMTRTRVHDDHEEIVPGRAYSYKPYGGGFKNSVLSFANHGATSLFTTVEDLGKWLRNFDTCQVAGKEGIELAQKPYVLNDGALCQYGFALRLSEYRGVKVVGHSGSDAGFRAWCGRFPEYGLGVVVLANLGTMMPEMLARSVADVLLEDHMAPVAQPVAGPAVAARSIPGWYHVATSGLVVRFAEAGGRIYLETLDGERQEAKYEGGARYAVPLLRGYVEFAADVLGVISGFTASGLGEGALGTRIPDYSPSAAELAEISGVYHSPELDTDYTLVSEGGVIVVKHARAANYRLLPAGKDLFIGLVSGAPTFSIQRNGAFIVGIRVTANRVRNLLFVRQ